MKIEINLESISINLDKPFELKELTLLNTIIRKIRQFRHTKMPPENKIVIDDCKLENDYKTLIYRLKILG